MNNSFLDILKWGAEHKNIYIESGNNKSLTLTQLQLNSFNCANFIRNFYNLSDGKIIVSILRPGTNWNIVEYSIFLNCAVHAPISLKDSIPKTIDKINFLQPTLIITDSESIKISLANKITSSCQIITLNEIRKSFTSGTSFGQFDFVNSGAILCTSGTTREQKYVFTSLENMNYSFKEFANSGIFDGVNTFLELLPYSFSGGRKVNYSAQLNQLAIYYQDRTKSIIQNLKSSKADIIACVPYMLKEILGYLEANPNDLSLKKIISGGAPLDAKLVRNFDLYGIKVYNVYGLTETTSLCAYNNDIFFREGSVGKISKSIIYKINKRNELLLKGGNISSGYVKQSNPIKLSPIKGFFNTKDIVELDSDGFLFIKGRSTRRIKNIKGESISLRKIEKSLKEFTKSDFLKLRIVNNEMIIFSNYKNLLENKENFIKEILSFNLPLNRTFLAYVDDEIEMTKQFNENFNYTQLI